MASSDIITLHLDSLGNGVDAQAYLDVCKHTLLILREVERELSHDGVPPISWQIADTGKNSPLFTTLRGVGEALRASAILGAFAIGMAHLQHNDTPPPGFNATALRAIQHMVKAFTKGVSRIEYSNVGDGRLRVSHEVAQHASTALKRLELEAAKLAGRFTDYGSIEGQLRELSSQSGRDKLVIVDELNGNETRCYFRGPEIEKKARDYWKRRVIVTGEITTDRKTRERVEMRVDDIRALRDRSKLPQIEDLDGIDIANGMDSAEYIRGLRDG